MVFINIPYVPENNRIEKDLVSRELESLDITHDAKWNAFEAIFNRLPRGVEFEGKDAGKAHLLENVLRKLGISFRQSEESEYI